MQQTPRPTARPVHRATTRGPPLHAPPQRPRLGSSGLNFAPAGLTHLPPGGRWSSFCCPEKSLWANTEAGLIAGPRSRDCLLAALARVTGNAASLQRKGRLVSTSAEEQRRVRRTFLLPPCLRRATRGREGSYGKDSAHIVKVSQLTEQ